MEGGEYQWKTVPGLDTKCPTRLSSPWKTQVPDIGSPSHQLEESHQGELQLLKLAVVSEKSTLF